LVTTVAACGFAAEVMLPLLENVPGTRLTAPLSLVSTSSVNAADFTIEYDAAVARVEGVRLGELTAGWLLAANTNTPGRLIVSMLGLGSANGPGVLAELDFRILESASIGSTSAVVFAMAQLYSGSGSVVTTFRNGAIVVADPAPPAAVTQLRAVDTPLDDGGSITLSWVKSADDGAGANDVTGYEVLRAEAAEEPFVRVALLPPGAQAFTNDPASGPAPVDGLDYYYKVTALDTVHATPSEVVGPVRSSVLKAGIFSPVEAALVREVAPLIGTVQASTLQSWTLEFAAGYWPLSDAEYIPLRFATGAESVANASLLPAGWSGWDTTWLADGQYTLRIRAYQQDLSSVFVYRTVWVDNTAPPAPLVVLAAPAGYGPFCKNGDVLTFTGTGEPGTVVDAAFLIGPAEEALQDVTTNLSVNIVSGAIAGHATLPATGTATVRLELRLRDAAGNLSPWQVSNPLTVDNAPPAARFVDPDGQVFVNRMPVDCLIQADDPRSGVNDVQVRVNNQAWQPATWLGSNLWRHVFNAPSSGLTYTLHTRATDVVGNVQTSLHTCLISYNVNQPAAWIHFPTNGYDLGNAPTLPIRVTALDTDADPDDFAWWLEYRAAADAMWLPLANGRQNLTNELAFDWPHQRQLPTGDYMLRLVVSNRFTLFVQPTCERLLPLGGPPVITQQPQDQFQSYGKPVTFTVAATGSQPLTYQWSLNGTNLPGATGSSYSIADFQPQHLGYYQVTFSNVMGQAVSAEAMLDPWTLSRVFGWGDSDEPFVNWPNHGQWSSPPDSLGIVELDAGWDFSVGLRGDGLLYGWGNPADGRTAPPANLSNVVQFSASGSFALALRSDGQIVGWGKNENGVMNLPSGLTNVIQISAGGWGHALALRADGTVVAWGYNAEGQATPPAGLRAVAFVAAGYANSIALKSNGTVVVWGRASQGSLNVPAGLTNVVRVSAGGDHCMALTGDGKVYCWGKNAEGQCNVPAGLSNVAQVSAGSFHSMALKSDGTVVCWGGWGFGRVQVPPGLSHVVRVAAGGYHSLALMQVRPPLWIQQPASQSSMVGAPVFFAARAVGGKPLAYQWRFNGVALAGQTNSSLVISNVGAAAVGNYDVVVTNAFGAITSAVAALSLVGPPAIYQQPQDQVASNAPVHLVVGATGTEPLAYQWFHNGNPLPHAQAATLTITDAQISNIGSYFCAVTNAYGSATSREARVSLAVRVDSTFDPGVDGMVSCVADQPDGKILVGGYFASLAGQTCNNLARLNPDGTLDTGFNPGANDSVYCLAVQPDGRILVGGAFTTLAGQARNRLGRLNPDGTLDTGFNPAANDSVYCLAVQPDGGILLGGAFTTLAGQARNRLGRLNPDGTLDTGFNPGTNDPVYCMAVQPDGKILVGGNMIVLGGQLRNFLGRLNPNGTLDIGFNPGVNGTVYCLAVQPDGRILVGGAFTTLAGQARNHLGRLNPDGTLDTAFNPGANAGVSTLALQADGKIVAGGVFTTLGGQRRDYLGRLNPDGTLDTTFNLLANGGPSCLAVQADGRILVTGVFDQLGGHMRSRIARLDNSELATQSLSYDGGIVSWLRGGTSPEVWRTTFDLSSDGNTWESLGAGTRIPGGWQLAGILLPDGGTIRARGFTSGGNPNGSCWFVESTLVVPPRTPPSIVAGDGQFGVVSNVFGFSVSGAAGQVVVVEGSSNLLQWLPLQTNVLGGGPWYFSDPTWATVPQRFYRARLTP